jgi:hypothetical protein
MIITIENVLKIKMWTVKIRTAGQPLVPNDSFILKKRKK